MRRGPRARDGSLAVSALVLLLAADVAAEPGARVTATSAPTVQRVHVVVRGDTLSGLAARYAVTVRALVSANGLAGERSVLSIGQRLTVPAAAVAGVAARVRAIPRPRRVPSRGPRNMHLAVPDFVEIAPPFIWPVDGDVTSTFGRRPSGWHRGIDIKAAPGSAILAAAAGIVVVSAVEPRYGRVVKIEHPGGFLTVYAHNEENLVAVGRPVATGEPIATVGRTGQASSDHVHFEIRRGDAVYNPLYLLPLPPRVAQVDLTEEPEEEHE